MKKSSFMVLKIGVIFAFGLVTVGCISTSVKHSPELTTENAATLSICKEIMFVDNIEHTYDNKSWLIRVSKFNGEKVSWMKMTRLTNVLIPPGEHIIECWIESMRGGRAPSGRYVIASIRFTAEPGKEYSLLCYVDQDKYTGSMDDKYKFKVNFGNFYKANEIHTYYFKYEDTPQFYKDMQEGKQMISSNTKTVIWE